jgi:uncharacterized protein with HEPN domain
MRLEARKYLHDIDQALARLTRFVAGRTIADYLADAMLRAAVERQFEIIGEAVGKLSKFDPQSAERIRGYRRLIAFRNVLIHGYAEVDDQLVWDLLQSHLPALIADVESLKG